MKSVIDQLISFGLSKEITEKKNQVHAIESTIRNLEKVKTPIPEELRNLKFSLMDDLHNWDEIQVLKINVINYLNEAIDKVRSSGLEGTEVSKLVKGRKYRPRISLADLISAGLIPQHAKLIRDYKGKHYSGDIDKNGNITIEIDGKVGHFSNPSAAAKVISELRAQDGWKWWSIEFDDTKEIADYYRQKYYNNENK